MVVFVALDRRLSDSEMMEVMLRNKRYDLEDRPQYGGRACVLRATVAMTLTCRQRIRDECDDFWCSRPLAVGHRRVPEPKLASPRQNSGGDSLQVEVAKV